MAPETLLAPICMALGVSFIWPQVIRVYRLSTVEGLSPYGTLHGLAGSVLWTVYGLTAGIPVMWITNLCIGIALLLIAAAQVRHRVLAGSHLAATTVGTAAVGFAAAAIDPAVTGWIAIVVGATSILPQAFHVLRSDDLSGVSVAMYAMVIANTTLWSAYGLFIGDLLIVVPAALVLPCSALIIAKALQFRSRTEPDDDLAFAA